MKVSVEFKFDGGAEPDDRFIIELDEDEVNALVKHWVEPWLTQNEPPLSEGDEPRKMTPGRFAVATMGQINVFVRSIMSQRINAFVQGKSIGEINREIEKTGMV